ncbi:MAG: hypothetical protein KatS3mg096_762 [Candidatus Parcubacteria bacterium]|nr:MAG: hypothetical protein KatS3mg096_762 [Candidatus Parcubacteria bacterium]
MKKQEQLLKEVAELKQQIAELKKEIGLLKRGLKSKNSSRHKAIKIKKLKISDFKKK